MEEGTPIKKRKVLFVVAPDFRDEEFFEPREVLEATGFEVEVASQEKGIINGVAGGKVEAVKGIIDVIVADYVGVVFVGGEGAAIYFDDMLAHDLAREALDQGKVVAAICIAPSILANAGLLSGVKATAFASERGNLEKNGAVWVDQAVIADGKIVTAAGPEAAKDFGWKIVELLG